MLLSDRNHYLLESYGPSSLSFSTRQDVQSIVNQQGRWQETKSYRHSLAVAVNFPILTFFNGLIRNAHIYPSWRSLDDCYKLVQECCIII